MYPILRGRVQTIFFAVVALLLINSLGSGQTKKKPIKRRKDLSKREQIKLEEAKAERDIGRNMAGRLLQFYGIYEDKQLLGYLNQVGNYVARFGCDTKRRYMFEVLDTDIINAFASPGGYILIARGAIKHARNEAQLAAVLAHEVAHVCKKHMFNTLKSMSKEEMEKAAKDSEKRRKLPPALAARKRPEAKQSTTGAMLARYLSGSVAGLSILQAAKAGISVILEKGLDAKLEYEADEEGVTYAINAGYHPDAMMNFLCRIEQKKVGKYGACKLERKKHGKKKKSILDKTHPPIIERVDRIAHLLEKLDAASIIGAKGVKRFRRYTDQLPEPKTKK